MTRNLSLAGKDHLTIHPTAESLVWNSDAHARPPGFIIACDPRTRKLEIDVELSSDPAAFAGRPGLKDSSGFYFSSRTGISGIVPPDRSECGKGRERFVYHVPARVWERCMVFPRIFYRATGRYSSGKVVCSAEVSSKNGIPFLHGTPSAAFYFPSRALSDLPRLEVVGNTIRQEGDLRPCILRGVNVSGLNHARYFQAEIRSEQDESVEARRMRRWYEAAQITPALFDRLEQMHVNLIRLPLNQDWTLQGFHEPELPEFAQPRLEDALRYLEDIDQVIAWAAERGIYVMLTLHTLRLFTPAVDSGISVCDQESDSFHRRLCMESRKQPYNGHLPDHHSWLFWSVLAQRYRGCTAVMFDLCNEPHEVLPRDNERGEYLGVLPSFPAVQSTMKRSAYHSWWVSEWTKWAEGLEEVVHGINSQALVFISGFGGPCWSATLENLQFRSYEQNPNVVFAVHWYWYPALGPDTWRRYLGMEAGKGGKDASVPLAQRHPVFVKEWGVETPDAITQESPGDSLSETYRLQWGKRPMPPYPILIDWGEKLTAFFAECADRSGAGGHSGFAGFAAWSTGDKPRIFRRERVYAGPYEEGFPTTDYGRIVERALEDTARAEPPAPLPV